MQGRARNMEVCYSFQATGHRAEAPLGKAPEDWGIDCSIEELRRVMERRRSDFSPGTIACCALTSNSMPRGRSHPSAGLQHPASSDSSQHQHV
eukprot:scaffold152099_cov15-Tisochrysis_lutea.AAC.1